MSETDAGILSRWSQRKLQARQQQKVGESEPLEEDAGLQAEPTAAQIESSAEAVILTDADMPPLETLNETSDYSAFMSSGVSDALRKMALKKLFHTPQFNIRDGLDEYDEDFTRFEALGDMITSDMRHQIELEAQRKLQQSLQQDRDSAGVEVSAGEADVSMPSVQDDSTKTVPQPVAESATDTSPDEITLTMEARNE